MHRIVTWGVILACVVTTAQAVPLNLTPQVPDIFAGLVQVEYDADTDIFSAEGIAEGLDLDGLAPPDHHIHAGTFAVSATIDDGGVASDGSLQIGGTIGTLGAVSGTLLTGTLTEFGFPDSGPGLFEFVFDVTGGDLAPQFYPQSGVILDAQDFGLSTGFGGSFDGSFSNVGTGNADVFATVIPEPITAGTSLLGLFIVVLFSFRRSSVRPSG